jgi:hypothetical protein
MEANEPTPVVGQSNDSRKLGLTLISLSSRSGQHNHVQPSAEMTVPHMRGLRVFLGYTITKRPACSAVRNLIAIAFITMLMWWLERRPMPTPSQVDAIFRRLVINGIGPSTYAKSARG